MQYENFDCEVSEGCARISVIGPGDPHLGELCDEFTDLVLRLQEDRAVRVILFVDGDHSFDYHTNIDGLAEAHGQGQGFDLLAADDEVAQRIVTMIQELEKPVVAATRGDVRDVGLGFYLAADIRLAARRATFTVSDLSGGLVPGWGLFHTLPRLIGPSRALEFMWSGRTLDAGEAGRIGLVDRVIEDDVWDEEIDRFLDRLRHLPQPAVRLTKLGTQQATNLDMTTMLAYEWESQQQCWDSLETAEGLRAKLECRPPRLDIVPADEED